MAGAAGHPARSTESFKRRDLVQAASVRQQPSRDAGRSRRTLSTALSELRRLRAQGRRAVCVIDLDCGSGDRVMRLAHYARALGFLAIEVWGFDRSPEQVEAASHAAKSLPNPRIGFSFALRPTGNLVPVEDGAADILIAGQCEQDLSELSRIVDPSGLTLFQERL